jgi:hypothetical protein
MKKAEEYFNDFCSPSNQELLQVKYDVILLLKRVQEDAIRKTVKECCEYATITYPKYEDENYEVDEQSILSVADRLIQQL